MRRSTGALLVILLAAGCKGPQESTSLPGGPQLPSVSGLATGKSAGPEVIRGSGEAVPRMDVSVDPAGKISVEGLGTLRGWRGVDMPIDRWPSSKPVAAAVDKLVVKVSALTDGSGGVRIKLGKRTLKGAKQLAGLLTALPKEKRPVSVAIDAASGVPFGPVARVVAAVMEAGFQPEFRPPRGPRSKWADNAFRRRLAVEAAKRVGPDGLSKLGVRIRADKRAPWGAVQEVLMGCMNAKVWRFSFGALRGGREVVLGRVGRKRVRAVAIARETIDYTVKKKRDVFKNPRVTNPLVVHEKVPVRDHLETESDMDLRTARGSEDAISDIPLGGTGVVRPPAPADARVYGYQRTGGWRKKTVARFGGSPATEKAVEEALRWLARHQEAAGHWSAKKWGGAAGNDEAVTSLATLALLSAGYTEKSGKYRDNVRRALSWMAKQQKADGRIGTDDLTHALCTQTLAEAYGMTKNPVIGRAAQKAIDRALKAQKPRSGWPKAKPDLATTAQYALALKSARVAGLKVNVAGFQGAMAFLNKITDKQGHCRNLPGGAKAAPPMTARGMLSKMFMGVPSTDKAVAGGAKHLLTALPSWGKKGAGVDFNYWHWGTLAAFRTGRQPWKKWNEALKKALLLNQRKGGVTDGSVKDVAGSWGPPAGPKSKKLGRAGATALGALCLETYYRYLPMYTK